MANHGQRQTAGENKGRVKYGKCSNEKKRKFYTNTNNYRKALRKSFPCEKVTKENVPSSVRKMFVLSARAPLRLQLHLMTFTLSN